VTVQVAAFEGIRHHRLILNAYRSPKLATGAGWCHPAARAWYSPQAWEMQVMLSEDRGDIGP
jgi:hypothetical protein